MEEFKHYTVMKNEAIEYFELNKETSKVNLLKYATNTHITLYKIGDENGNTKQES